ncbi:MAG: 50S ribosomal protein L24 [Lachnospiraceae bacterium]|nr:50S ribosomal protein L24 [Lachnospiraceae bacterium]
MAGIKVKKGDVVQVIAGKDKGKSGKIIAVDHKKGRVRVEGLNMMTKHTKPSMQNQNGGIITTEAFMDVSNVMYLENGKVTRIGYTFENGEKKRVAKSTDRVID